MELVFHVFSDGIHTTCTLGGVGIGSREMQSEVTHGALPGYRMMGHAVIEHPVHVKKYGLWYKLLVSVLRQVVLDFVVKHNL